MESDSDEDAQNMPPLKRATACGAAGQQQQEQEQQAPGPALAAGHPEQQPELQEPPVHQQQQQHLAQRQAEMQRRQQQEQQQQQQEQQQQQQEQKQQQQEQEQQQQQPEEAAEAEAEAGSESEEDREDEVLEKVSKIANKLRAMLGDLPAGEDGAGPSAPQADLVTREQLVEGCGPAAAQLKSYQLVGINFLMMLHKSETVGGAILADEMGLGKTAQTINFLGALRAQGNRRPHLVVCPTSLVQNWHRELQQWCPGMRVLVYHGKERDQIRDVLQQWRRRVRGALEEGRIKKLPPGVALAADEGGRRGGAAARAREEWDLEDKDEEDEDEEPSEEEAGERANRLDDGADASCLGGLQLPAEDSGEAAFDVLLTTYSLFERDTRGFIADKAFLLRWRWSYMVADEAHALKNRSSVRTRKLRRLGACCEHRILLTGTPLQNSLEELRALLEFLMPSLFIDPNNPDQDDDSTMHMAKLDDEEQAARVERYKQLLAPFILRRLKSEVATQLMSKQQIVQEVDMTPDQDKLYQSVIEGMRREVAAAAAAAAGTGGSKARARATRARRGTDSAAAAAAVPQAGGGPAAAEVLGSMRVRNIFTHLRKVAQHPLLVRHLYTDEKVQQMASISASNSLFAGNCTYDRVLKEMLTFSDHQLHNFANTWRSCLGEFVLEPSVLLDSAKIQCLEQLLPRLQQQGSKVLLFSQWTMTLDLLEWYARHKGYKYVRLDGDTQAQDRITLVDRFNAPDQDVFVFLLSTRAGGQGLNLTSADTVVLHDVDFNPQVDRQAEDRCHRLGQTKPVTVYRLITKNTVDQNVLAIAERKLALDAAVLGDGAIDGEGDDEPAPARRSRKGGEGADAKEVKQMGSILSALLSGLT